MKSLFDSVCTEISQLVTSRYSTSFSLAVKMLSPSIQPEIHAIYGFVRLADEIVDTFHGYEQEMLLNELEQDLQTALKRKISTNPILHSFQETVHKYGIDYELVDAFLKSMRFDLHKSNYDDTASYEEYIYGSADVVGLMCLKVFVGGDQEQYDKLEYSAKKLGSAFQKVNFLRDLKDDTLNLQRSYFPNLKVDYSLTTETKEAIIREIEHDFDEAYKGIIQLPVEAKFGVYTAYIYYRRLLQKLKETKAEKIMDRRIRISNPIKIGLLARSFVNYKLDLM